MDKSYELLVVVQKFAPNGAVQIKIALAYNEAKFSGVWDSKEEEEKSLCTMLAGLLYDGLAYGNW